MSSLRSLVLTPQRTPSFVIVTRSPLLFLSPRLHRRSPDRTRLLSDPDDSPGPDPPEALLSPAASPRFLLHRPRIRPPHRADTTSDAAESADTDLTTRAAMSLPHVRKVITPYGFRAVLAASPCTRRRESLFHRNKPVTVTVTDTDQQDPWADPPTPPNPGPDRSPVCLRPIRAFGLQVMKELRRPAAALKALSPATRTRPR
ncbi:C2 calcium-dependent domain-containing protein 4C-like [Sebastes umbrosus]|uniref:C2 calcium-dependent domain-containing protein 4C-like n=1 Tax=Sebastes umbrosus TaxID=72105 RepID=UPI00189EA112|nr:C2 calcium-dependent domain-containing protein 4C-like [Sebastes umbrosus]XP_037651783.1 C2 calcium-dependent domain-containing protein 4C-like [Sebastes umbrosus]